MIQPQGGSADSIVAVKCRQRLYQIPVAPVCKHGNRIHLFPIFRSWMGILHILEHLQIFVYIIRFRTAKFFIIIPSYYRTDSVFYFRGIRSYLYGKEIQLVFPVTPIFAAEGYRIRRVGQNILAVLLQIIIQRLYILAHYQLFEIIRPGPDQIGKIPAGQQNIKLIIIRIYHMNTDADILRHLILHMILGILIEGFSHILRQDIKCNFFAGRSAFLFFRFGRLYRLCTLFRCAPARLCRLFACGAACRC